MTLHKTLIENGPTKTRSGTVYERVTKITFNDGIHHGTHRQFKVKVSLKRDHHYPFQSTYGALVWSEKDNAWHQVASLNGEDEFAKTATLDDVAKHLIVDAEWVLG